jgi:hypothetical protein
LLLDLPPRVMRCLVGDRREPRLHGDASADQPPG